MKKHFCDSKLLATVPYIIFYYWKQKKLMGLKKNWKVREFSIKTYSRSSTILPYFCFCLFKIHNGQKFINLYVTKKHFYYKLGPFACSNI